MNIVRHIIAPTTVVFASIALLSAPAAAVPPGDFDDSGYVGLEDLSTILTCMTEPGVPADPGCEPANFEGEDTDVDAVDFAKFQALFGHTPIQLKDTLGIVLSVGSTNPYSGRQTCGGLGCHDLDDPAGITNGKTFQQGRTDTDGNVIMKDDFFEDGRWWHRSPGRFGVWSQATTFEMAGKDNANESVFDQSAFAWTRGCSGCHTGAGSGEFDRDGELLYNEVTGQFGYEVLGKTPEEVYLDGDYADFDYSTSTVVPARWDLTGLSEPDCLFCHRAEPPTVHWREVILSAATELVDDEGSPVKAFAAAATAGHRWFSTLDAGANPPVLQIDYSVGVADGSLIEGGDGTVYFDNTRLQRPPLDKSCWLCHTQKEVLNGMVWFDDTPDVHYRKFNNLSDDDPGNDIPGDKSKVCNYCHPGGLDHNFAKGNDFMFSWRDELDWVNFRTCRDCHLWDGPVRHPDAPEVGGGADTVEVHLVGRMMEKLSCQACHIPHALGPAIIYIDTAAGGWGSGMTFQYLSADPLDPTNPDRSRWYPPLMWKTDSDGVERLFPTVVWPTGYWADWDQNGTPEDLSDDLLTPILLWRINEVTGGGAPPWVTDDNGDYLPEVNRPEEILAYIEVLKGNDSYGRQIAARPVQVKGPLVWYEDPQAPEGVNSFEHEGTGIPVKWYYYSWGLDHNVLPKEQAWGAGGDCQTCHRTDGQSPVFDRLVLVDPYDVNGQPVYKTVREMTGVDTTSYHDNIVLKDAMGNPLTVTSTAPYSGRETCSGTACHDIDRISNGLIHQQGRTDADGNIVMQDDFLGDGRWWVRSAGMYGRNSVGAGGLNRQTAGKTNANESEMDMTAYYWAGFCGACHAGGGGMEFDRDGIRYWDEATGQFGYEVLGQTPEDVALDGDYAYIDVDGDASWSLAPWDVTGVAGPECLHCHRANRTYVDLQDMHREWRAAVLGTRDALVDSQGLSVPAYAAAGTAGQGWFSTLDTEATPPVLQIDYSVGVAAGDLIVGPSDELVLPAEFLARPPRDQACWGCHLPGGFQGKRGTVWFDERDVMYAGFNNLRDGDPGNDIPPEESTACVRCHPGNIDHNFAKGDSPYAYFREELNWEGFRSCRECHLTEIDGLLNPLHDPTAPGVPGGTLLHLAGSEDGGPMVAMSCQGCHVPYALEQATIVTDRSVTGTAISYMTNEFLSADPLDPTSPDKSTWYPALVWKTDSDGLDRLFPQKLEVCIYWADWDQNGTPGDLNDDTIQPIILWRMRQITGNQPLPVVTDDNGDGKLEINRPAEMLAYMQALQGVDSYGRQVAANPVLVKGERVWYSDPQSPDGVSWFEHEGSGVTVQSYEAFGLDHNVLEMAEAWGAGFPPDCGTCHRTDGQSPVFDRLILIDPWDENGDPVYRTVREMTGAMPPP